MLLRSEVGASLEERFEDGVGLLEVVVYDVHEEVGVHDLRNELSGR